MGLAWTEILLGVALPVMGGVTTYLATAGLVGLARRRQRKAEYARLRQLVYAHIDDLLTVADRMVARGQGENVEPSSADAWAITSSYWIRVQTRYAELCDSPGEVHEISRFFEYAVGLVEVVRPQLLAGVAGFTASGSGTGRGGRLVVELRNHMHAQADRLKATYWPPGYKSTVFPHHPNPPAKFD